MNNNKSKGMLISIIVFLIVFLPITIFGGYLKISTKIANANKENPNHNFYYEGKLYFYDEKDNFLGTYLCTSEICGAAVNIIDDNAYSLNYDSTEFDYDKAVINNRYVFVNDNNKVILYDIAKNNILGTYSGKKEYSIFLSDNQLIVRNKDNLWGVVKMDDDKVETIVPFSYEFIGVFNNLDSNNNLIADNFVVMKDTKWALVSNKGLLVTAYVPSEIISYTSSYLYTKLGDTYETYDYDGNPLIADYKYKKIDIIDSNYLLFVSSNNELFIYDVLNKKMVSEVFNLTTYNLSDTVLYPPYSCILETDKIKLTIYSNQEYGTNNVYSYYLK